MSAQINNIRPEFDREIVDIVDYVMNYEISSRVAYETAHYCLLDTPGCGLEALEYPACKKLLGPIVPGTVVPNGVRVPGTQFQLDPVPVSYTHLDVYKRQAGTTIQDMIKLEQKMLPELQPYTQERAEKLIDLLQSKGTTIDVYKRQEYRGGRGRNPGAGGFNDR